MSAGVILARYVLSNRTIEVLSSIKNWRIAASGLDDELPLSEDSNHHKWMQMQTHNHPHREILFVISGEASFGCFGKCYKISPGDVLLINSLEHHDDHYPPWTPDIEHLWLTLLESRAVVHAAKVVNGKYTEDPPQLLSSHITTNLQHTLFSHTKYPNYMLEVKKLKAYAEVATAAAAILQAAPFEHKHQESSFQEQIIGALEQHIKAVNGAGINIENLAQISGYSRFHLSRLFKEQTGLTMRSYINKCKAAAVAKMQTEGYNKKEIANILAFSSQSAFSRWYRQNFFDNK